MMTTFEGSIIPARFTWPLKGPAHMSAHDLMIKVKTKMSVQLTTGKWGLYWCTHWPFFQVLPIPITVFHSICMKNKVGIFDYNLLSLKSISNNNFWIS